MQAVVLTIHLLLALALILVVLLQRSEGGGLGMGSGGGGLMTSRGAATALSKVTWALGAAFVVTSLALTIIAARDSGSGSVIDRLGTAIPMSTAPVVPPSGLDGDLLPSVPAAPADTAPAPVETAPVPAPAAPAEGPATPPPAQ